MSKTITISVDEDTDKKIRRYAMEVYGNKKGALQKAYKDAVDMLTAAEEQEEIRSAALKRLEKGVKSNKKWKFSRDELYER
jgi:predicted transcriptional regulator